MTISFFFLIRLVKCNYDLMHSILRLLQCSQPPPNPRPPTLPPRLQYRARGLGGGRLEEPKATASETRPSLLVIRGTTAAPGPFGGLNNNVDVGRWGTGSRPRRGPVLREASFLSTDYPPPHVQTHCDRTNLGQTWSRGTLPAHSTDDKRVSMSPARLCCVQRDVEFMHKRKSENRQKLPN